MNKFRRKQIETIADKLSSIADEIDAVQEEEEEYRDNIPENLQGSERYELAEAAVDALMEAADSVRSAIDSLEQAGA